ncbi:MAG: hypothetical protein OEU40_13650, partial [Gammaproteobacteria bacterium]|nr:hypothetical protein [Gammaproteobacteria bacterium]
MTICFQFVARAWYSLSSQHVSRKRAWNWTGAFSALVMIIGLAAWSTEASAYERYKNVAEDPGSNCSACHGDFTDGTS